MSKTNFKETNFIRISKPKLVELSQLLAARIPFCIFYDFACMLEHMCILPQPFCVNYFEHIQCTWGSNKAWMTFVNPEKAKIVVEQIPKSANVFDVYWLKSAMTFRTAKNLIVRLSQEGISGLPMRFGIINNSQATKLECWKDFRNRFCLFSY